MLFPFLLSFITAYIDPGTGSIIIQAIIGLVLGVFIAIKLFWHRIHNFFRIRKSKDSNDVGEDKVED